MDYMLMDSSGNAVDSFSDARDAEAALVGLINDDPSAAKDMSLLAFDRRGRAVGEAIVAADLLPERVVRLELEDSRNSREGLTVLSWAADVVAPAGLLMRVQQGAPTA